jgi:cell division protein FtsB
VLNPGSFSADIKGMVKLKLLFSLCVGTAVYVILSLFAGNDGLLATRQLETELTAMSVRSARLEALNTALKTEANALQQDPEVIAAYARRLGFAAPGEKLIKVQGRAPIDLRDPGAVFPRTPVIAISEWVCKLAGISAASLTFTLLFLAGVISSAVRPRRQNSAAYGIPKYA